MNLETFSQHGEERVIERYCSDIPKGIYLDMGAGDPVDISNTYGLYKFGWRGVLVEPLRIYHEDIAKKRSEDKLCKKVITDYVGEIEMLDTAMIGSTLGDKYKNTGINSRVEPCYTINEFFKEYPEALKADFLNLDVETSEEKILKNIDFKIFKPRLMCIEYLVHGIDYRDIWGKYVTPFYNEVETMYCNVFYLRKNDA